LPLRRIPVIKNPDRTKKRSTPLQPKSMNERPMRAPVPFPRQSGNRWATIT
jgi:hypothetical protein